MSPITPHLSNTSPAPACASHAVAPTCLQQRHSNAHALVTQSLIAAARYATRLRDRPAMLMRPSSVRYTCQRDVMRSHCAFVRPAPGARGERCGSVQNARAACEWPRRSHDRQHSLLCMIKHAAEVQLRASAVHVLLLVLRHTSVGEHSNLGQDVLPVAGRAGLSEWCSAGKQRWRISGSAGSHLRIACAHKHAHADMRARAHSLPPRPRPSSPAPARRAARPACP